MVLFAQEYGNEILASDNDAAIELYHSVKKLSKNFTELPLSAKNKDSQLKSLWQTGSIKKGKETSSLDELSKDFVELFNALKNNKGSELDEDQVMRIIDKKLRTFQVGEEILSDELSKKINNVKKIKYDIPGVVTKIMPQGNIPVFQQIVDSIMLGDNVYLVGGAGTGKTTLAQNVAEAIGREYMTINCSQWTTPTEIIGGETIDGYSEGKLIEAWKHGYMLILDELPKLDPNTAGLLNDALAKSKHSEAYIFNPRKEKFKKHPNFCVVGTGNIYPNNEKEAYGANNKQDLSLLDRFTGAVYWIEKNPPLEQEIVGNYTIWDIADRIRTSIEKNKLEAQISLRFMIGARDVHKLQLKRLIDREQIANGITLKDYIDSFLSTFEVDDREIIKSDIDYPQILRTIANPHNVQ